MNRAFIILALFAFIVSTIAASPPSFCKCTCFTNSTIIPLSSHGSVPPNPANPSSNNNLRAPATTCAMCNRAFCLSQRLPICKDAEEKDVFTTCFQRDSRKDQIVVLTFITGTLVLLGWAAIRKVIEQRKLSGLGDVQTGTYVPIGR